MINRITLGAPNIYRAPDELRRTLGAERMDVCAFVGVAPRGPCRIPIEPEACQLEQIYLEPERSQHRSVAVAVESWDEYHRLYGGFDGPGRLPYALATFFEQGGQRAYVVRIVHEYGNDDNKSGLARAQLTGLHSTSGPVFLTAKNEGSWGNRLIAALAYTTTPLAMLPGSTTTELILTQDQDYPVGSLFRLTIPVPGSPPKLVLRFVSRQGLRGMGNSEQQQFFTILDVAVDAAPIAVELIEGDLLLEDGNGFQERFNHLALAPEHPRWIAKVLYRESELVNPDYGWISSSLTPSQNQLTLTDPLHQLIHDPVLFSGGVDRYQAIEHSDFFDHQWVLADPRPGDGIHALTHLLDLASVVVPDLYFPQALPDENQDDPVVSVAGAEFSPCIDLAPIDATLVQQQPSLPGLLLDPGNTDDLKTIISLQTALVDLAVQLERFVILLDVPPGLNQNEILIWRSNFLSSYVAAYYPWLTISNLSDNRDALIRVNPSAVAAGIIARQELTFGVPHGPANVIAAQVIKVDELISPQRHDQLHPQGINIFLQRRDGVWLTAARTLSSDKRYRQLSVRRLMIMLQRVLARQMFWVVFEPNNTALWSEIRHLLDIFLRQLFVGGAFKGRNEQEAYFIRCDSELNHQRVRDAGQLIVEIGVAPAEPLEFIVVRITRSGDGTLAVVI